jgi:ABC-type Mn2+/Zn2+ transport system ATPase subunit
MIACAQETLRKKGLQLDEKRFNIAVAGPNGNGKSSLVKGLMHVLGNVRECAHA